VVLQGVPPAELEQLAAGSFRLGFEPGEAIFTAGSAADALFVIDAGTVVLDGAVARAEAAAGELLGERSLLPGERHVTTASAGSAAELLRLDRAALLELLSRRPAVGERLVTLVHHRIRQESRLAGETVPPDIPGRVLAGLQDVMAASGEGAPAFEVLPVYIGAEGPMLLRPSAGGTWLVDAAGGRLPAAVIQDALAAAGVPAQIVHSTSWRFEAGRLVLTYLAVMPAPHAASGFHAEGVRRAELARGTATGAPAAIDVAQVVEHGLRHLCWLSRDDPVIREELSPEWLAAVAEYQPEPFRAL
jgi:hypothetical protein